MAIVHVAIYDAINAITHRDVSFTGIPDAPRAVRSTPPSRRPRTTRWWSCSRRRRAHCDQVLAEDLARIPDGTAKDVWAGGRPSGGGGHSRADRERRFAPRRTGARRRLHSQQRAGEVASGSDQPDPARAWRALGRGHAARHPIRLHVPRARRRRTCTAPPYTRRINEVKRLGGDGITTRTERTPEQTMIGLFWAYDGTPSCARRSTSSTRLR